MGNQVTRFVAKDCVLALEKRFMDIVESSDVKKFERESYFALQALNSNNFLMQQAAKNPDSLRSAVLNVATVNLSLNPALKQAYLVPRDGQVCLDISYMGLAKLATDSGSVLWIQAELVKENDEFLYKGVCEKPMHEMNPFSDRGKTIGVYCISKLSNGDFLVSVMSIEEVHEIRNRSKAWSSGKSCPWRSDPDEMTKKVIVKRATKLLPKTDRLSTAIDVINQHEGIDFNEEQTQVSADTVDYVKREKKIEDIKTLIDLKTESMSLVKKGEFLSGVVKLKNLDQLRTKDDKQLDEIYERVDGYQEKPGIEITTADVPF